MLNKMEENWANTDKEKSETILESLHFATVRETCTVQRTQRLAQPPRHLASQSTHRIESFFRFRISCSGLNLCAPVIVNAWYHLL